MNSNTSALSGAAPVPGIARDMTCVSSAAVVHPLSAPGLNHPPQKDLGPHGLSQDGHLRLHNGCGGLFVWNQKRTASRCISLSECALLTCRLHTSGGPDALFMRQAPSTVSRGTGPRYVGHSSNSEDRTPHRTHHRRTFSLVVAHVTVAHR